MDENEKLAFLQVETTNTFLSHILDKHVNGSLWIWFWTKLDVRLSGQSGGKGEGEG